MSSEHQFLAALCPNPFRDTALAQTRRAQQLLQTHGVKTAICPIYDEDASGVLPEGIPYEALRSVADRAGLLVCFGGDGTILHAARAAVGSAAPILGINMGTKGFLAELEPAELHRLTDVLEGRYTISSRAMLDVSLTRGGQTVFTDCALNDAVVRGLERCIHLNVRSDGQNVSSYTGDGVVIATATGSTAYSLSAGGPIVEPEANNILLTPICAHLLGTQSYVLQPERVVTVRLEALAGRPAFLSVDGGEGIMLSSGDVITARISRNRTHLVSLGLKSFYEIAYEKLSRQC